MSEREPKTFYVNFSNAGVFFSRMILTYFTRPCKYYHYGNLNSEIGRQSNMKATGIVRRIDE